MGALWKNWSIILPYAIANGLSIRKENPMEHGDLLVINQMRILFMLIK